MLIDVILILGGLAAAAWGVSTAERAPRPKSLGAGLVAALGLALALAGAARLFAPGFF